MFLVVLGAAVLASSVLPRLIRPLPVSLPILQLVGGIALYLVVVAAGLTVYLLVGLLGL